MSINKDKTLIFQKSKINKDFINSKQIGPKTFIGTFSTSIIIQIFTVIQGIFIARLLGPIGRGEYAAVILWPNMFAAIGIFGSNIVLARIAAKEIDLGAITRTSILIGLLTSTLASITCYFSIPYLMPSAQEHIISIARLFILFIPINHIGLNIIAIDQGSGNFKNFNITRLAFYPLYIVMILGLWLCGKKNVNSFTISLLIANLIVVFLRLIIALRKSPLFGKIYSLKETLKSSLHFGLAGIAIPIYLQADKALILWLLDAENLGFYTVALSASAVIGSVTGSMGMVSFTMAAQSNQGDGFEKIAKAFRISVLLWIIFGSILALLMRIALPLVYGTNFIPAINAARLLILGSAFAGLANLLEQSMRGQGKAFVGLEGRIAGLVVMTVIGLLLVKPLGLNGLCIAYILCQLSCLSVIIWRTICHYTKSNLKHFIPNKNDINIFIKRIAYKIPHI